MSNEASLKQLVSSPCIDICELNHDNICIGCYRSIDEITVWRSVSHSEQILILNEARKRKALIIKNK